MMNSFGFVDIQLCEKMFEADIPNSECICNLCSPTKLHSSKTVCI